MTNKTNLSDQTNMSNMTNKTNKGGYENLIVYRLGVLLYGLNADFCKTHLPNIQNKRTVEQMIQAARSGKQNIVEGSMEKSAESYLKLLGVARASFGELGEDYKDYLLREGLKIWFKNDPRVNQLRSIKISNSHNENKRIMFNFQQGQESFANLMITLIFREVYVLDRLLKALENKFIKEGGFRENLFKKRIGYRNQQNK